MKKLALWIVFACSLTLLGIGTQSQAANDCLDVEMQDADLCISIDRNGSNRYDIQTDVSNTNGSVAVRCTVLIGSSTSKYVLLQDLNRCEGTFTYTDDDEQAIKFYIFVNNEYKTVEARYDFDEEEFTHISSSDDDDDDDDNDDLDDFDLSADPDDPDEDEWVDVTIEALDDDNDTYEDYRGTVEFTVQYRTSSSSSRRTASSSLYDLDDDEYTFRSSDDGEVELRDLVRFTDDSYNYRLMVEDDDENVRAYLYFCFDDNNCDDDDDDDDNDNDSGDLESFDITADPDDPDEDEWVDVTIEALDDDGDTIERYTNTVRFFVEYKINSSASWNTPSSLYYDLDRSSYTFRSADDGEVELRRLVRFENDNYDYRLMVEDDDENVRDYVYFCFNSNDCDDDDGNSDDLDDFDLSSYPSTPNEDQRADVYIEAMDKFNDTVEDYRGTVEFTVQYRSSSSASRRTASSSLYDLDDDEYTFKSSDDGKVRLYNFVRFTNDSNDYRLRVEDEDENVTAYLYFCLNTRNCDDFNNDDDDDYDNDDFNDREMSQIRSIHRIWNSLMNALENKYPVLRNNSTRQDQQEDLYDEMGNILDNDRSIYNDYDEFYDAFIDWYSYTLRLVR